MEPTESAAPDSRLRARLRRGPYAWLSGRRAEREAREAESARPAVPSTAVERRERAWSTVGAYGTQELGVSETSGGRDAGPCSTQTGVEGRRRPLWRGAEAHGPDDASSERDPWPVLPVALVTIAAVLLGTGFFLAFTGRSALFPSGTVGWSLAVLTGLIVGHLVALGRDRWWGGTGSGGALTVAVLLLYGWVPAGMVSLTVVVLVGVARRHRWRQGVLH
ncbi:MAG: GGDEF-domain containing protein, partial [Streptomyces sp.]